MKQLYILLLFSIFSTTILTAQWGYPSEVYATDNYVLLYGNSMGGEVFINDSTTIGNNPYSQPYEWHFIAMFDTASNHIWHKKIGSSTKGMMDLTIDNNNSIYIASSTGQAYTYASLDSISIDSGMYVLKLDEQGNILNLIQPTQWDEPRFLNVNLTTDSQNNLYLIGNVSFENSGGSFSFGNLPPISTSSYLPKRFIAKFDEAGIPIFLDTLSLDFTFRNLEFVNNELLVAGGNYLNQYFFPYENQHIAKLDTNGNLIKYTNVQGNNLQEDEIFTEYELASDGYWISGSFTNADFGDGVLHTRSQKSLYLAKYDFNDSLIYLKLTPDSLNNTFAFVQSLSVNDNDEVFWQFAVPCNCTWTIDGQTAYSHNMIKLNPQGNVDCITEMNRLKISANSTHYFSLNTYQQGGPGSAYFNLGKWNNNCYQEWENFYIWHVFAGATTNIATNTFQIFPNPATNQLFLKTERTDIYELQYQILSVSGQVVQNGIINPSESQGITLKDFASGVYFLRLQSDETMETLKFVKY